jgi:uncharacterized membrane protein
MLAAMSPTPTVLPKARVETLVDGIFAIAMTLLILEVKVPVLANPRSMTELQGAMAHTVPTVAAYLLSFFMLGVFWLWHHRLADTVRGFDAPLLAVTIAFLALVSGFPFVAALMGRYFRNLGALAIYFPVLGLLLLSQVLFMVVARRRGLLMDDFTEAMYRQAHRRNLIGLLCFTLGTVPGTAFLGLVPFLISATAAILTFLALKRA